MYKIMIFTIIKLLSRTTVKDTWTKPRQGGGSKGGRWVWLGWGGGVGREYRQL